MANCKFCGAPLSKSMAKYYGKCVDCNNVEKYFKKRIGRKNFSDIDPFKENSPQNLLYGLYYHYDEFIQKFGAKQLLSGLKKQPLGLLKDRQQMQSLQRLNDIIRDKLTIDMLRQEAHQKELEQKNQEMTPLIKQKIVDMGSKYQRLEIREIAEVMNISDHNLIVQVLTKMIQSKEIYAQYFKSSNSIAFDQKANLQELEHLDTLFEDWSYKEKSRDSKLN